MRAMILAAGLGTRMRPLTNHTPKPLLKVGGKPLIVWHIERLKAAGFREIVINVAYLGDQIMDYLGDGSHYGVRFFFSDERDKGALETAGGIIRALPLLSETFLVVNGDIWTDYPYDVDFQLPKGKQAHLVLVDNPKHHPKGDFPLYGDLSKLYTFSGIAYYHKSFFEGFKEGKRPLAPLLFNALAENLLSCEHHGGEWYDIGTVERLQYLDSLLSRNA